MHVAHFYSPVCGFKLRYFSLGVPVEENREADHQHSQRSVCSGSLLKVRLLDLCNLAALLITSHSSAQTETMYQIYMQLKM